MASGVKISVGDTVYLTEFPKQCANNRFRVVSVGKSTACVRLTKANGEYGKLITRPLSSIEKSKPPEEVDSSPKESK